MRQVPCAEPAVRIVRLRRGGGLGKVCESLSIIPSSRRAEGRSRTLVEVEVSTSSALSALLRSLLTVSGLGTSKSPRHSLRLQTTSFCSVFVISKAVWGCGSH